MRAAITTIARVLCALALLAAPLLPRAADRPPDAITADGGRYYGALVDGLRQGPGRVEWVSGARYEGGFERGLYSGRGVWESGHGDRYDGDFVRGERSGTGRLQMADGSVYVGEFRGDAPGGTGELRYADGHSYRGEFLHGHYNGKGHYETLRGEVYDGDFANDVFTGTGTYRTADGAHHDGAFVDWIPEGPGRYTDPQGTVYAGGFAKGKLSGIARVSVKDGSSYEGELDEWMPHGEGTLRLANGDVYKGRFQYGLYDGAGTLTYAKAQADGRTQDTGVWSMGRLDGAAPREARRRALGLAQTALYTQRTLLTQAIEALPARTPGRINLYLLAVAGDGKQEVFRREVDFVRAQFERDYAIGGRAVALVNSRNTVETQPMATTTSLRAALSGIAARMDRNEDILFLFLTSHGSKDHQLALDLDGIDLASLPAQELGAMLRESGIRWKVVVVSACYGGGFIDALKDERTLIIAAARRDRTSFGCADENEFTDFGRAYFKEALPRSTSFQDAFDKATSLIDEWEKRDGRSGPGEQSLPQMDNPAPIEEHLRRWWAQARPKPG